MNFKLRKKKKKKKNWTEKRFRFHFQFPIEFIDLLAFKNSATMNKNVHGNLACLDGIRHKLGSQPFARFEVLLPSKILHQKEIDRTKFI